MAGVLRTTGITKNYPGVTALQDVDFELDPGEVHALVGENGAGKTTLIKILTGLVQPDCGVITLDGQPRSFSGPLDSQAAGIAVIEQELNLVPQMTVGENIFLGHEPTRAMGLIDWGKVHRTSRELLSGFGLNISPSQMVELLGVCDKQLVEIAKALSLDFRILIMDEPTATLGVAEVERLFKIIEGLRERGLSVIYVSHRLKEIFRVADRVTILRDGRKVDTRPISGLTEDDVVTMMLGRELASLEFSKAGSGEERSRALSVRDLSLPGALESVSLDVDYGEVVGVAGLVGSGRTELMRALFGLEPRHRGHVLIDNKPARLSTPVKSMKQGLFMLPEDRKTESILPTLNALENLVITAHKVRRGGVFIDFKTEKGMFQKVKDLFRIRVHSASQLIGTLSGGNQQKVAMGRAIAADCRIVLLNEPTRGVDVGAKAEIHELIRNLAKAGRAIVVSSSDTPELALVCDRCLTLVGGRQGPTLTGEEVTADNIVACVIGHSARGRQDDGCA